MFHFFVGRNVKCDPARSAPSKPTGALNLLEPDSFMARNLTHTTALKMVSHKAIPCHRFFTDGLVICIIMFIHA